MTKLGTLLLIITCLCLKPLGFVSAQSASTKRLAQSSSIRHIVSAKETKWKFDVVRSSEREGVCPITFNGKRKSNWAHIFIHILPSQIDAQETLREHLTSPVQITPIATSILGIGDEATLLKAPHPYRYIGIFYRKQNYFVRVDASSVPIAERFARHLESALTEIQPDCKTLEAKPTH